MLWLLPEISEVEVGGCPKTETRKPPRHLFEIPVTETWSIKELLQRFPRKLPSFVTRAVLAALVMLGTARTLASQDPASREPAALNPTPWPESAARPRPRIEEYIISRDDLLDISVFDVPEISRAYRVSPSGSITLALVPDPILAAGLTLVQLSQVLGDNLRARGIVTTPRVTVEVKESRIHCVAVAGAVKRPQLYPVYGRTTLLDVISQAEGLTEDAGNTATITRGEIGLQPPRLEIGSDSGGPSLVARTLVVDLKRLLETGDAQSNVHVYPGDRITVQRAGIVYVVGAVSRPGGFTLKDDREEMTVLKAIALAQDLKSTAIPSQAAIIRKDPQTSAVWQKIPVNLRQILAGRTSDRPLQTNDILFVPDSASKKAMARGAEAVVQIATGVIIWRR